MTNGASLKLYFIIDKEYDIQTILSLKKAGLKQYENMTRGFLESRYKTEIAAMKLKQDDYQESWDEIGDRFSDYVEKITGYGWFYPRYECVLSIAIRGASNWGHGPRILRIYNEDPYLMRRITAHEIILSHYFEIYRRHYSNERLTDGQVWALAEIAAFALTSLTEDVKGFWQNTEYYTNHNYPQIVELQNKLKKVFIESVQNKDFDYYIKMGIEMVRGYPDISPMG